MVQQIADKAGFDAVLKDAGGKLVVVDFTATWCGPCQRIGPKFVEMAGQFTNCVFIKVDVDDNEETAAACGIKCMPTFQFYVNGEKVDEMSGADEATLKTKVEGNIPK
uniref:Thioredoxin n=1 Tax=Hemiselmis tepida TaxID=464990 RepID=A0A7S0Z1Y9_9CRYP|eukprot:CAMPEP_0174950756 /NCGR_PEP_ID=MMETSP1355-20121228/94496_1 /TAXON_ID=464990 /ORGANISM="Hemiselmis tepida, Strain CCMP443" /LENGTH=107 /DNA_ID=CAMNT_0016198389 /DNA_START=408 /DNA_END=731 /DNA_ORIENTATION=-